MRTQSINIFLILFMNWSLSTQKLSCYCTGEAKESSRMKGLKKVDRTGEKHGERRGQRALNRTKEPKLSLKHALNARTKLKMSTRTQSSPFLENPTAMHAPHPPLQPYSPRANQPFFHPITPTNPSTIILHRVEEVQRTPQPIKQPNPVWVQSPPWQQPVKQVTQPTMTPLVKFRPPAIKIPVEKSPEEEVDTPSSPTKTSIIPKEIESIIDEDSWEDRLSEVVGHEWDEDQIEETICPMKTTLTLTTNVHHSTLHQNKPF